MSLKGYWRWLGLVLCVAIPAGARSATPTIEEAYSPRDELRILGATHTLVTNDIDEFMKPIREHGYNAVMVHGLDDGWGATYPSRIFPFAEHRNFKPDTLQKIIEACHAEGIKVIVYAPLVMLTDDPRYTDATPEEAAALKAEGKKKITSLDSSFRDLFVGALKEIAALGADGFWLDGYSMEYSNLVGAPHAHGAEAFRKETGLEWPMEEDWESDTFRRWVKWRYKHHMELGDGIVKEIRAEYPHIHVSFNTHFVTPMAIDPDLPGPPLTWNRWREGVPLARFPDTIGASNHARLGPSNLAQSTPFWSGMSTDMNPLRCDLWQPTFAERVGLNLMWRQGLPADALGLRLSALAAFTFSTQIWPEGDIHTGKAVRPETYTEINDAIRAREEFFGGKRVTYCGVYLSNNTRDYWGLRRAKPDDPRNTDRLFTECYFGLASLLMQEHIQFSHFFDNNLSLETLRAFPVVFLPNVACLSDAACDTLRQYVEGGGRLIATYETSLYDEWGERREDFGLGDLFGAQYKETRNAVDLEPPHWIRELKEPGRNDGLTTFAWQSRRTVVEARPGAELVAVDTGRYVPGTDTDASLRGSPAVLRNKVGQGEALYIVDDVSQGYYQSPYRSIPAILRSLILDSPPPFRVEAPAQIIANGYWQEEGRRLVVHLLNLPPMSTRLFDRSQLDTLDEVVPVHDVDVVLHLPGTVASARLVPAGIDLPVETGPDGALRLRVPRVAEHEMVVIDLAGP